MKRFHAAALTLALAAGFAAAAALTVPSVAQAWDVNSLPAGFTTFVRSDSSGGPCPLAYRIEYVPSLAVSGYLCTDSPTFQQDLDAFVDANYTAPVTTNAATTPAATSTVAVTTDAVTAPQAPSTTTTATASAETVTVTTVITDPTIDARLTALEQKQAVTDARIAALEANVGIILGEVKSQPPFTNPA